MKKIFIAAFIGIGIIIIACEKNQEEEPIINDNTPPNDTINEPPQDTTTEPPTDTIIIKSALFLGNSYTYHYAIPHLTKLLAKSAGDSLVTDSVTPGGVDLKHHAESSVTLEKITSKEWDFVSIQGQSQETSLDHIYVKNNVFPYAKILSDSVKASSSLSMPLFYMTWGRKNGDEYYCPQYPWVCTYLGMDDTIRANYILMGEANTAWISPVGAVWRYLRENHPDIDLYRPDNSHSSEAGAFAAACTFYTMIFEKDPELIQYNYTIPDTDEEAIKSAAKIVVYDQIADWKFN